MEPIVSQIIEPIVSVLNSLITKHLRYLISSRKYVVDMTKELDVLVGKSDDLKRHMDNNKVSGKEIPTRVPAWLAEVENVKKDVESILRNEIGCLHMKNRYQAGRNSLKTIKNIERLINEEIKWSDAIIPLGRVDSKQASMFASLSVSITQNNFNSRVNAFKEALNYLQLNDKANQVIALCGPGGVGKTTMMDQLKNIAQENKMFDWIVKVAIGQNYDILSVQNDIAAYIDVKLPEGSKMMKADYLCKRFENLSKENKKILVILDDVWDIIEIKYIGLTSPLPNGVKLLLTSRISNICTQIAACVDSNLRLVTVDVLEEGEARKFFFEIAGVSQEHDHEMYGIGCKIIKKCSYLPLAIKLIASALKSQEIFAWRNALSHLKKNDLGDSLQEIIRFSYNYIKKDEQQIFLHCSLFPEDSNISIEDLFRQTWGLKLFENVSSLKEARDEINTWVGNLINANLLIYGDKIGHVKMHDLVLAFALGEVSKGDHAWIINHGDDVSKWGIKEREKYCKRLSLTCSRDMSEFPMGLKYQNLSLLQLRQGKLFPEDFCSDMEKLEVIAFYDMKYPPILRWVLRSLHCFENLSSLCLHNCKLLFDLSFVGNLVNLEVLSFAHSEIHRLPSTVGKLRKLKLLDLTFCYNVQIDDGVFKNLNDLEELYMNVQTINFEELKSISSNLCALEVQFDNEMSLVKNMNFNKLDKFKISVGCLLNEKESEKTLNILKFQIDSCNKLWDSKINELFEKTDKLHLQVKDMTRLKDISYNQHSFSSLRDLKVSKCDNLKYLFPISIASGFMRKLEALKISACSALEALVENNDGSEISVVFELPQLVELEVSDLPKFMSIYSDKNNNYSALLNSQVRVPELKTLIIKNMNKLKHICPCEIGEGVNNISSMLRDIRASECLSLENLFPTNPMPLFNNLEQLHIQSCNSLKEIFNIDLECIHKDDQLTTSSSSRLRTIYVYGSENLTEVWRIKGGDKNNNSSSRIISGFEAVESIEIKYCVGFKNLFRPTNTKFDMGAVTKIEINCESTGREDKDDDNEISIVAFPTNLMHSFSNLQQLQLEWCDGVEVAFETDLVTPTNSTQQPPPLLPNLQDLRLYNMYSMSHVWKWGSNFSILQNKYSFHNLTEIQVKACNKIKYLFSPRMAKLLSNLKIINIECCDVMEEVVSNRDDKDEDKYEDEQITTSTNFFPHLQYLYLGELPELKRIGGGGGDIMGTTVIQSFLVRVVSSSLCQNPREINLFRCPSLMEVFETQGINNVSDDGDTPKLAKWNVPQQFNNLKKLVIRNCDRLKYVFMFSILESLTQLEELDIVSCLAMEVIVKEENEERRKVVEFSRLKKLTLLNLPKIKDIFIGINEFNRALLENVKIIRCPQMQLFIWDVSTTLKLKYIYTSLGKHSLECGANFHDQEATLPSSSSERLSLRSTTLERLSLSFHNLIEIDIKRDPNIECIIPFNELHQLQNLERIRVDYCGNVRKVFEVEATEGTNSESPTVVTIPNLTQLELAWLSKLKYIWNSNHHQRTKLEFPKLTRLSISSCDILEHVFNSCMIVSQLKDLYIDRCNDLKVIVKEEEESQTDHAEIPNPRQVELMYLQNLTTLSIVKCGQLEYVFTSSMIGSVQKLQHLIINDCSEMKAIVKEEEEEDVKQIVLPCLESMSVESLGSLEGFCLGKNDFSFPVLNTLKIKECPEIIAFTKGHHLHTPALKLIETQFALCYVNRDDLNSVIQTKLQEGFEF